MDISRPDLKQKKRRRQFVYVGAGIVTLIAIAFGLSAIEPAAPKVARAQVWIDAVKRGEMKREVRGPGTLVPKEVRWIAAETAARVDRFLVKPGALVRADTVIMELSNPEVMDQLLAARSEVTAAEADHAALRMSLESQVLDQRANMAGIEADYESARLQVEAEAGLNQKGIVSDINFRRSELTAERLKVRLDIEQERIAKFKDTMAAQIAAGRARIDQLRNTLALRERQADSLKLKAGIDGVLQQVPVEVGQQVAPGSNLARVARPDVLIAELRVAETQAKDVLIGQKVAVDTRNGIVEGLVARIDPAVLNGTVQVDVDLVGALPAGARPDLSIDGTIEIERLADVLYVGRPAYGQPESDTTLFRIDAKTGIATRVPVRLGRASVTVVEVSRGLAEGDQVVLSDTAQWDKYDRLKLQ